MGNKSSNSIPEDANKYSKHEKSVNKFQLFLCGYFREILSLQHIPTDIVNMIIKYYKLNQLNPRLYLLSFHQEPNYSNSYIVHCSTNKTFKLRANNNKSHRLNDEFAAKTALEYEKLPHSILRSKESSYVHYRTQTLEKQQKRYSMYATVGGVFGSTICQLIAFELEDVNARFFVSELPSFPFPVYNSSLVYSAAYHTLFAINGMNDDNMKQFIYSLDFASRDKEWDWKLITNKLLWKHCKCFGCMVDDRFIAIFGADTEYLPYQERPFSGELFALNCNQSIKLCDTNTKITELVGNGTCVYTPKYHQIVVCDTYKAYLYDINKDYWFKSQTWSKHFVDCDRMLKLRISSLDPNVMFAEAISKSWKNNIVIKSFDLRTYKPMTEYYFDFHCKSINNFVAPILL